MNPNVRVSIAYVAGSIITQKAFTSVQDVSQGKDVLFDGRFQFGNIDVVDKATGKVIAGMINGKDASFFHAGENVTVTLKFNGNNFTGRDSGTNRDFSGSVTGVNVKIYDYTEGAHFYYSLHQV